MYTEGPCHEGRNCSTIMSARSHGIIIKCPELVTLVDFCQREVTISAGSSPNLTVLIRVNEYMYSYQHESSVGTIGNIDMVITAQSHPTTPLNSLFHLDEKR